MLCPDVGTVKQREKSRGKVGYTGFTVEALYESFLRETPRIGFWLDNSNQTPDETAEATLRHFYN